LASVKQEVNAVWTVLLGCRGLMGHGSLGSRFFLLPQPTGHRGRSRGGGWSEVARTTGITTSAQTRVKRGGDDESRCRRLETKNDVRGHVFSGRDEFRMRFRLHEKHTRHARRLLRISRSAIIHSPRSSQASKLQASHIECITHTKVGLLGILDPPL
jgi:hypothetical protein